MKFTEKKKFFLVIIISFLFILLLNYLTPIIADDYSYSLKLYGEETKIDNMGAIFINNFKYYNNINGRLPANFITMMFLMYGKGLFNIFNALMYEALTVLIYFHILGKKKLNGTLLLFINLMLWIFIPSFSEDILWLTGSCNYLWMTVIILGFLLPFRFSLNKESKNTYLFTIFMFFLGLISGISNGNMSIALLILEGIFLYFYYKKYKNIPWWMISSFIGSLMGLIILLSAPCNFKNNNINILYRIYKYTKTSINVLMPLWIITLIFNINNYVRTKKINLISIIYITGSIFALIMTIILKELPSRAYFGIIIFLIISIGNTIIRCDKLYIKSFITLLGIIFIVTGISAVISLNIVKTKFDTREKYIKENKVKEDLIVDKIKTSNKYSIYNSLEDIGRNFSKSVSKYYDLKSIKLEK